MNKTYYKLSKLFNATYYFSFSSRLNGRKAAILLRLCKKQVNNHYKYQYGITSRWSEYNEK